MNYFWSVLGAIGVLAVYMAFAMAVGRYLGGLSDE